MESLGAAPWGPTPQSVGAMRHLPVLQHRGQGVLGEGLQTGVLARPDLIGSS
jgi:hypothetical protein